MQSVLFGSKEKIEKIGKKITYFAMFINQKQLMNDR